MRALSSIALVLGDACNFSCAYCRQRRGNSRLTMADIRRFLDFLEPRSAEDLWLGFCGGEPLLHWPLIAATVKHALRRPGKRFRFALTTNGSLLKKEQVQFFRDQRFALGLSHDGLAQKTRDAGSVAAVEQALEMLLRLYPGGYTVNSVFTPRSVALLAASMEKLMRRGHRRLRVSFDLTVPWPAAALAACKRQLAQLAASCLAHRRRTGEMPLANFLAQGKPGVFACAAGRERLALLPDRTVWGCELLPTLLVHGRRRQNARVGFGTLDDFITAPRAARAARTARCAGLRQDFFISDRQELCALCPDLERCSLCPALAAQVTGRLGVFPDWTCRIQKLVRRAAAPLRGGG